MGSPYATLGAAGFLGLVVLGWGVLPFLRELGRLSGRGDRPRQPWEE